MTSVKSCTRPGCLFWTLSYMRKRINPYLYKPVLAQIGLFTQFLTHTATKWWSWDSNSPLREFKSHIISTLSYSSLFNMDRKKKKTKWHRKWAVHSRELGGKLCLSAQVFPRIDEVNSGGMMREGFMEEAGYKLILH